MPTLLSRLCSLFLLCLLSACAGMSGPKDVQVPLAKLQENLDKRFPMNQRVLEMFDIKLTSPQLSLLPNENRLVAKVDALVAPPLTSKTWNGSLTLSGVLRVDPNKNTIYLSEPRLEDFAVDGIDAVYKRQITRVGNLLFERVKDDFVVYTFNPEQLKVWGVDFSLMKINTSKDAVVISFAPVKK